MSQEWVDEIESAEPVIAALADGGWMSGPRLAVQLGVSRSAVSARVARLRAAGIDIYAVSGKGYRLAGPVDLLEARAIRGELSPAHSARLDQLILRQTVDSTNSVLAGYRDGAIRACLAERQTAGRGRAGRAWVSPFAANLYLSVAYELAVPKAPVATVSLAVGVAMAEALDALGVPDVGVKWPNDLWIGQDKVGGILTEARAEAGGGARLIVGLGLNVAMPRSADGIDQPWTHLVDHLPQPCSRSVLAGRCLDAVLEALTRFEHAGFEPFLARWTAFDRVAGQAVDLVDGAHRRSGVARGIGSDGSLRIEIDGREQAVYAGDISVRLAPS
ncbi:biotin--[acetyl-CoA-carboxylase] ligase [Salinisphaera sp. SPP-AMP-43]|uniref:biotin--[acetyl-CoA-carboxylase] ligase n=1 Tax=Salinisphaera sp. SPP-AMP-43 TaxID=3121288 RepID=UPI003C6E5E00